MAISDNRVETVLASIRSPVLAVDRGLRIVFANPAARALFDSGAEVVGTRLMDLVPGEMLPPRRAARALRDRKVCAYEVKIAESFYLCQVSVWEEPRHPGWVAILTDVTQLKELDRLKSQMIQMTSHDLKNPLQAAMSYVELLIEDGATVFTEDMHYYIHIVWTQLSRLYRIISGILDLERIQAGTPAFAEFGLENLLGRVMVDMADQARTKGVTLELRLDEHLPFILGDAQLLGQAIANLVDNAVKFTPSGGNVWVKAQATERQVVIDVTDSGIGIPEDELDRVFDRFYQGQHQQVKQMGGTGLGLSLVKAIVDSHHGKVELESQLGRGTTVRVRLPVSDELAL